MKSRFRKQLVIAISAASLGLLLALDPKPASAQSGNGSEQSENKSEISDASEEKLSIVANKFSFDKEKNIFVVSGDVVASLGDRTIKTESLEYDRNTGIVVSHTKSVLTTADTAPLEAQGVKLDTKIQRVIVDMFETIFASKVNLSGEAAVVLQDGTLTIHNATYSTCEICADTGKRLWEISSPKVVYNRNDETITYSNPRLEVMGGMPIMWAPWIQHSGPGIQRSSGILIPSTGQSSALGLWVAFPVFIAVGDHTNIKLTPFYSSRQNGFLSADVLTNTPSGNLGIRVNAVSESDSPDVGLTSSIRWSADAWGSFKLSDKWNWGFGLATTSDSLFNSRYGVANASDINRALFIEGIDKQSHFRAEILGGSRLVAGSSNTSFTTALPQVNYSTQWADPWDSGMFALKLNALRLSRSDSSEKYRLASKIDWDRTITTDSGVVINPFVSVRSDFYYDNFVSADTKDTSQGYASTWRIMPSAGAELIYPLSLITDNANHIITPKLQVIVGGTNSKAADIVNDDSFAGAFDETNLFASNRFSGWDLVESGSQVNAAVAYTRYGKDSFLSIAAGQSFHFGGDNLPGAAFGDGGEISDYVAGLQWHQDTHRLAVRTQFDRSSLQVKRFEASTGWSGLGILSGNVDYGLVAANPTLAITERREQFSVGMNAKFSDSLNFSSSIRYDMLTYHVVNSSNSLNYHDDCISASVAYTTKRYANTTTANERTIKFTVSLGNIVGRSYDVSVP